MKRHSLVSRRTTWIGIAFAAPFILNLVLLVVYPLVETFYYSFTDFNLFQAPQWVGLKNYARMLNDRTFWQSASNTAVFAFAGIPIYLTLALVGAHILNTRIPLQGLWRAIIYLPSIVPVVVSAYLWKWLFNGQYGFVNYFLGILGLPAPNWLVDPQWMKPATIIMIAWTVGGTTLIYLAGLREIPAELYEAASLDGAGPWRSFWSITWPMLSPITLFQSIVLLVAQIQIFNQPMLIVQEQGFIQNMGGAGNSNLSYTMYLFQNAFNFLDMGYASAMAAALFVATLVITGLLLASTRKWVTYDKN